MDKTVLAYGMVLYRNVDSSPKATLSLIKNKNLPWEQALIAESRYKEHEGKGLKDIRDAMVVPIPSNPKEAKTREIENLSGAIDKIFKKCEKDFIELHGLEVKTRENLYQLLKYSKGQFIVDHVDSTKEFPRKITMIYYPNDDYEGGNVQFPVIGINIKPPANSAILFFSDSEDFRHASKKITSGVKYAVVGLWH